MLSECMESYLGKITVIRRRVFERFMCTHFEEGHTGRGLP